MRSSSITRPTVLPVSRAIRVLVVDDSVVIRRLVKRALEGDDQIEVVGVASNGAAALHQIAQLAPDVITLDIEMPEMDGLEALRRIRQSYPHLPVVMFSTVTERGAGVTLDALALGANDYVTKAFQAGSLDESVALLRSELAPKLKQFFRRNLRERQPPPSRLAFAPPTFASRCSPLTRRIVVIGSSTGGPNALAEIMPKFPKDFGLPILIVQHMPAIFTRLLAERLNRLSQIEVTEVEAGAPLVAGRAFVAAGGSHMRVARRGQEIIASTDQEPPENSCRPAVDVTLRSVLDIFGAATITVMLTGMGNDGLRGTGLLKKAGAYVIAQDQATSVVWGMPGAVVKAGFADATVPLSHIVPEILRQV